MKAKLESDSRDVCVGGSPGKSHTINPTTFDRLLKEKSLGVPCLVACKARGLMVYICPTLHKQIIYILKNIIFISEEKCEPWY